MCSKRCANPVRPGFSFFEPTWNHWFTWTIGSFRSTWRMTCSPFGSVYFSNSIFGTDEGDVGVAEAAGSDWPFPGLNQYALVAIWNNNPVGWVSAAFPAVTLRACTLATETAPAGQRPLPDGLTAREAEVLRLVASGRTNGEIADLLVVSVRTVETHLTHAYTKIGARNRADATAYALRRGLAEGEPPARPAWIRGFHDVGREAEE